MLGKRRRKCGDPCNRVAQFGGKRKKGGEKQKCSRERMFEIRGEPGKGGGGDANEGKRERLTL